MPKPPSVSYEDVEQVCTRLELENRKISARAIQAETGGSMSTVLTHYKHWQETRGRQKEESKTISDEIKGALNTEISRHVTALRFELSEQITQADNRAEEARVLLKEAEDRISILIEKAEEDAHRAEEIKKELESRVTAAEQKASYLINRNDELERSLQDLQGNIIAAEKKAAVAEERASLQEAQITKLEKLLDALKTELSQKKDQEKKMISLERETALLRERLTASGKDMATLQERIVDSEKKAAVSLAQADSLRLEKTGLNKQIESLQEALNIKTASYHEAEKKAAVAEANLARSEKDMASLNELVSAMEKTVKNLEPKKKG